MSFHAAIRSAVVARLKTSALLTGKVFSLPPANFTPPIVIVGKIKFEGALTSDDRESGFYIFSVETWAQTSSPLDLDRLSDAAFELLQDEPLTTAAGVALTPPDQVDEDDALALDAPGGAVMTRAQTFRLFAQPA